MGSGLRPNNLPKPHMAPQTAAINSSTPNPPEPVPRPPPRDRPPPRPPPRAAAWSLIKATANIRSARRENSFRSIVRYQAHIGYAPSSSIGPGPAILEMLRNPQRPGRLLAHQIKTKFDSKTEPATLAVCGLWPCRFVFVLESISALTPHGLGVCTTVLKTVDGQLS